MSDPRSFISPFLSRFQGLKDPSQRPFLYSFLIVSAFFGSGYLFFTPYFQENDDVFKLFFAKGVGTGLAPSEFLGHSNILAGLLLSKLYEISPKFPWYGFYLFLPMAGGLWAYLTSLLLGPWKGTRTLLFFFLLMGVDCFFLYQFEFAITPQLATQGGLFLLAALWREETDKLRAKGFLLAGSLFLCAAVIRLDGFLLTLLIAFPWFLFLSKGSSSRKDLKTFLLFLIGIGLVLGGAVIFSRSYYASDPGWKEFIEFNDHIEWLKDYRDPVYNERTKAAFDEIDWTPNDLRMFRDFCYVDPERNTIERYRRLMAHFPRFTNHGKSGTVSSLEGIFLKDAFAKTFVLYLCLALLFVPMDRVRWILLNLLWILGTLLLLIYFYRCPQRLYLPCLAYLARLAVFYAEGPFWKRPGAPDPGLLLWIRSFFFILGGSLLPLTVYYYFQLDQFNRDHEIALKQEIRELGPKDDQLFVIWASSFHYEGINAFDDLEDFRNFHIYPLAVFQRSPHGQAMLRHFGVSGNLFLAMIDNPRLFLICNHEEAQMLTTYLWEKFKIRVRGELYHRGEFWVFRLRSLSGSK